MLQHSVKLTFQQDRFSRNWTLLDPRVRAMVYEVAYHAALNGYATYVTSVIRSDGIHAQRAACDVDFIERADTEDISMDYQTHGRWQASNLNRTFKYGRSWLGETKPCALWHGGSSIESREGWHLHVQAPPGRSMIAKDPE